ncbi:hypothetical protein K7X08_001167 [Anisodus acutangulus]|uniref:F-box domain-containing protein n=1 Tax=Anisodus acutangulus TaxID=402998 RepID=A0A9Q1MN69_9SOLA|nr:hypothetical protein K7X08_001167 [Anisodus acutangulus]
MTPESKRAAVEEDNEDRFSALPNNLIDDILMLLPVHDAARTSILSKKWRYIWAMLPNLVLDKQFCNKLTVESQYVLKETIDKILLQHLGDMVKILLDVSRINLCSYADIDRWIGCVTRNCVKELTLGVPYHSTYELPSHVFSCPTLKSLELHFCLFKPPNSFIGFQNLINLYMNKITFVSTTSEFVVINVPRLVNLTLIRCKGTQYLNFVVSSPLKYLAIRYRRYNGGLSCFTNCKDLKKLYLIAANPIPTKRSKLENLLSSLPIIEALTLDYFVLERLSAGTVQKGLPFTLNCLWHLWLGVCFVERGLTSYALELIKSSPNLSKLEILVSSTTTTTTSDNAEAVLEYLNSPTCLDRPLHNLKDVSLHQFKGSKAEMFFVKLLFARTPSLIRMRIEVEASDSKEERNINTELMGFPRASGKAELFYTPYSD